MIAEWQRRISEESLTNRSRRYLITSARHTCLAAILFSFLASTAWGQDAADLRISTLTSQLKQGDSFVRWRAAKALLRIGSYSKAEVPALIEALKIEEADISDRARDALVKIGPDAVPDLINALKYRDSPVYSKPVEVLAAIGPPAAPALIEALKDRDKDVRRGALEALSQISPKPEGAFPILIELMKDPDPAIRNAAAQNITCCGAKAATAYLALIEALKDQDPNVRATAAFKFCGVRLAPGHPVVQPALALLLETLKNPDASVRSGAAQVLAYLGSTAKPALDAAIKASKDPDAKVRSSVALALGKIEPAADAVVTALLDALRDSDKTVRSSAASALKSAPARAAIYPLIVALQDSEASVRRSAADSLARPDAGFAVPRLIQLMSDQDTEVRNAASRALEAIGHNAGQALVNASKAKDADIRIRAAMILERVDPKDALAAHIEALKDEDAVVRSSAASSLGRFAERPEATTIAPELIEALRDRDASVRRSAARSLGSFTYNATVIPALREALKDPDNRVRYTAAKVLSINGEPKLVVPIFIAAMKDQDPQLRIGAASALRFLGPDAKAATPALLELLDDRSLEVCKAAATALGNFEGEDPAVIAALIKLLKHRDKDTRDAATQALASIGPPAVPLLLRLLMGRDSALRIRSYYALLGGAGVSGWIGALKSRDPELRSLVLEILGEESASSSWNHPQGLQLSFDPTRKYVLHTSRNTCGFEGMGRTYFLGEIDSGSNFPFLVCCPASYAEFLKFGGKYFVLIQSGGDEAGCHRAEFWLYDVKAKKFVIHAEGYIAETEPGVFSYGVCDDDNKEVPLGTVTMNNLLNRVSPLLRLLPLPMHAFTLSKNTRVTDRMLGTITIIRNAGTRLLVVWANEGDGSIDVYYKGAIATAPKGSLKLVK